MRIVEILVAVNALCGIAAFIIAKGLINNAKKKIHGIINDDEERSTRKEISP